MLDLRYIVNHPDEVRRACRLKCEPDVVDEILECDRLRRIYITERDDLRRRLNELSRRIAELARSGADTTALKSEAKEVSAQVKSVEEELRLVEERLSDLLLRVPNIPHPSVPEGRSEEDNVVVRTVGEPPKFDFEPKDHLELNEKLHLFDFARSAKITGAFFPLFVGDGARLVRALVNFMIDIHTKSGKYKEVFPAFLVNRAAMVGTAQLPKLEDDMYHLDQEDFFLIPTAEVPLTNLHRGENLREEDLPLYYCAYTACFRREAGSYGKETRGLMRLHQFDKVELVKIVHPDTSFDELEDLVRDAERVVQALGLYYRVVLLSTGDLTFASAKTYDIEVYAPGTGRWLEVSSISNLTDFQARRMGTRFRSKKDGKLHFVHTLNGSGVAVPRLVIALLESYQNEDGSVTVPEALRPYFRSDRISPE